MHLRRFVFFVLVIIFQFSVLPRWHPGMFAPDFLLTITILMGLFRGIEAGCLLGLIGGFLTDVNMGIMVGGNAFAWVQIGFLAALAGQRLLVDNIAVQMSTVAGGCLISGIFQLLFLRLAGPGPAFRPLLVSVPVQAAVNTLMTPLLIRLLLRLELISMERHD